MFNEAVGRKGPGDDGGVKYLTAVGKEPEQSATITLSYLLWREILRQLQEGETGPVTGTRAHGGGEVGARGREITHWNVARL